LRVSRQHAGSSNDSSSSQKKPLTYESCTRSHFSEVNKLVFSFRRTNSHESTPTNTRVIHSNHPHAELLGNKLSLNQLLITIHKPPQDFQLVLTASAAFPPSFNTSIPICEHTLLSEATAPFAPSQIGFGYAEASALSARSRREETIFFAWWEERLGWEKV